jgi:hypothetical protein
MTARLDCRQQVALAAVLRGAPDSSHEQRATTHRIRLTPLGRGSVFAVCESLSSFRVSIDLRSRLRHRQSKAPCENRAAVPIRQ